MPLDEAEATTAAVAPGAMNRVTDGRASVGSNGEPGVPRPISRSLARQAVVDTFASTGARVGMVWLFLLAFFAVFSPFLASSHPLLMKKGGEWSSPLVRNLTPGDALFLIATAVAILLGVMRRYSFGRSLLTVVVAVIVAAPLCFWLVKPLQNMDYAQYRSWTAQGRIERAIYAPVRFSPSDRLRDQPEARLTEPGKVHWLGTDTNGADVLSEILHACRIALSIGFIATGISVVLGILIGGVMGYYAGMTDLLGMRLIEIFEAIPRIMLLIIVNAFIAHRNIYIMMTVIGLTGWTSYARYLRAEFLTLRQRDFVQAAVAAGLPRRLILFRHMLANGLTPILVSTTFGVASAILYESILSFLGLGLVDEPSWGGLLNQARAGGAGFVWWIALFPGLAIFLTVFSYNLVGEAVRDALDPKLRKRD
jgi:peptide/nickel transport system permease protein